MTRFNLYQGATLLPLLLMLLLQEWLAAGVIVVTLILVLIAVFSAVKKPLELQIESRPENTMSMETKSMLVEMLQQEIPATY